MLRSTSRLLQDKPESDYGKAVLPAAESSSDSSWLLRARQRLCRSEMSRTRSEFGIPSLPKPLLQALELHRRCSGLNLLPGWCSTQYDTPVSLEPAIPISQSSL